MILEGGGGGGCENFSSSSLSDGGLSRKNVVAEVQHKDSPIILNLLVYIIIDFLWVGKVKSGYNPIVLVIFSSLHSPPFSHSLLQPFVLLLPASALCCQVWKKNKDSTEFHKHFSYL